ncbi:MAG: hypothetical protein QW594_04325 [Candidatus Woesearchaeota archaeon]
MGIFDQLPQGQSPPSLNPGIAGATQQQQSLGSLNPKEKALMDKLGELGTRMRLLEERYATLRKKTQLTEQSLIHFEKDINDELKALNEQVGEFKRDIHQLKEKVEILLDQLSDYARDDDVKIIAKYLELINPSAFVRKDEVMQIINQALTYRTQGPKS